eukprot:TRINITY_DN318_c0_g1_i1.p1 TRINITY_DN318_c0_g1~~TRINITY_DN318_c0_g1_i1.p1  ORF type:complete len:222 (-),score=34.71 TRINITY_DN318_c0_g1_i1:53-718(-)
MKTSTLEIPAKSKHTGSVIFLHGLGDTGYGWKDVADYLTEVEPHLKVILPTASNRPVTINHGMIMPAWYDIKTLTDRNNIDQEGLDDTKTRVHQLIEKEIKSGIPSRRIILGGFSQGAASSLWSGYQFDKPLGGIIALSGYIPGKLVLHEANKNTQLLMCHGKEDDVVLYEWGKYGFEVLKKLKVPGEFKTYEGLAHSASQKEIEDVFRFIRERIPTHSTL